MIKELHYSNSIRLVVVFSLFLLFPLLSHAQHTYDTMVTIPGVTGEDVGKVSIQSYLNVLYSLAIVAAGLFAVVKLVLAGATYMMSDVVTSKGQAIEDIKAAIVGLLIILVSVVILNTINPQLGQINFLSSGVEGLQIDGVNTNDLLSAGTPAVNCIQPSSCTADEDFRLQTADGCGSCVPKVLNTYPVNTLFKYSSIPDELESNGSITFTQTDYNGLKTDEVLNQMQLYCNNAGDTKVFEDYDDAAGIVTLSCP